MGFIDFMNRAAEAAEAKKVEQLRGDADKKDKRAIKMSEKHMRGGRRARKASIAAESIDRRADRLSEKVADTKAAQQDAEAARLEARRENFRRTGRYDG